MAKIRKNIVPVSQAFESSARDFQVLGSPADFRACSLRKAPVVLYSWMDWEFPMTADDFATAMPAILDPFNPNPESGCAQTTNLETNSLTVCAPTVITGVYMILETDAMHWSIPVDTVPATPGATPEVLTADARDVLTHGFPGNEFVEAFSRMYTLRMRVCRSEFLKEATSVIPTMPTIAAFEGAGNAVKPVHNEIRCYNDRLAAMGNTNRVLPMNSDGTIGTPGPTVSVMKGGSQSEGLKDCFKMPVPILWAPSMPAAFTLERSMDPDCLCALQKNVQITCETMDAGFTDVITGATGTASICTYPAGRVRVGLAFCGYECSWGCFADLAGECDPNGAVAGYLRGHNSNQMHQLASRFGDPTGKLKKMLAGSPTFRDRLVQEG